MSFMRDCSNDVAAEFYSMRQSNSSPICKFRTCPNGKQHSISKHLTGAAGWPIACSIYDHGHLAGGSDGCIRSLELVTYGPIFLESQTCKKQTRMRRLKI